jgi:hypothetical protein
MPHLHAIHIPFPDERAFRALVGKKMRFHLPTASWPMPGRTQPVSALRGRLQLLVAQPVVTGMH